MNNIQLSANYAHLQEQIRNLYDIERQFKDEFVRRLRDGEFKWKSET